MAFSPLLDYVDVRDIDFDGSEDFGVLCDTTHNEATLVRLGRSLWLPSAI